VIETRKEKVVRFLLIGFFIIIVILAFSYRQEKMQISGIPNSLQAIVLHASIAENDNPVVILYENKNKQNILGMYEVEKDNQFKFKTMHAMKLNFTVEKISSDIAESGFWVFNSEKWLYFNNNLQEERRSIKMMNESSYKTQFTFNKADAKIVVNENQFINIDEGETPFELHSLSEEHQLWLVLTDKGVKIAKIDVE